MTKEEPQNPMIQQALIISELLKVLFEKGLLTKDDLKRIRDRAITND